MPYIGPPMREFFRKTGLAAVVALAAAGAAWADTAAEAYRAMGVEAASVLSGTVLNARVVPGPGKQVVSVTTYFTGDKDPSTAVSVRFDVFQRRGETLVQIYTRDIGEENGGNVGRGDLQLVDLDNDGINEIILTFDLHSDPLIEQRVSEVVVHGGDGFATVWTGPVAYDSTRAAREVPVERRDRYRREIDLGATIGSRGETLFFKKTVIAVAGERLQQPKLVRESFPLRDP